MPTQETEQTLHASLEEIIKNAALLGWAVAALKPDDPESALPGIITGEPAFVRAVTDALSGVGEWAIWSEGAGH